MRASGLAIRRDVNGFALTPGLCNGLIEFGNGEAECDQGVASTVPDNSTSLGFRYPVSGRYLIAMGFSGEPTAPGMWRGWAARKKL